MGTVYRAQHLVVRDYVALKLLRSGLAEDESIRKRFLREPQLAAQIRHPNIIPIRDAGDENGLPYLAMEYVEGLDLGRLLERERRLEPERAIEVLGKAAGALDAAHARDLVHRDVKPANILVGNDGRIFLTDFGIAKNAALDGLTRKDAFIGTIQYAAPEQIRRKQIDGRTDVYALGCVLYHCLAGAPPFERDTEYDLMDAHVNEPPPRPSEAGHPAVLDAVIARAMAKTRDERYASSVELIAEARAALEPPSARGSWPPPRPSSRVQDLTGPE